MRNAPLILSVAIVFGSAFLHCSIDGPDVIAAESAHQKIFALTMAKGAVCGLNPADTLTRALLVTLDSTTDESLQYTTYYLTKEVDYCLESIGAFTCEIYRVHLSGCRLHSKTFQSPPYLQGGNFGIILKL